MPEGLRAHRENVGDLMLKANRVDYIGNHMILSEGEHSASDGEVRNRALKAG